MVHIRTVGHHLAPTTWMARPTPEVPGRRMTAPSALVQIANGTSATSSIPCEWCCNLMTRARRSRTSHRLFGSRQSECRIELDVVESFFSCEIILRQRFVDREAKKYKPDVIHNWMDDSDSHTFSDDFTNSLIDKNEARWIRRRRWSWNCRGHSSANWPTLHWLAPSEDQDILSSVQQCTRPLDPL